MLSRRTFIGSSLALMASSVTASVWGASADSVLSLAHENHLTKQKWAMAFEGVMSDFAPLQMETSGFWPSDLTGFLYRNGPSKMSRAGTRYQHWFDGDGMVQQFDIAHGKVSHKGKFIQTKKFKAEEKAGKFRYNTAGTLIPDALPIRNNDDMNVANTSVIPWRGELLALWEAGSPYRIEPNSLDTLGVKSFGDKFKQLPFSAHPLPDGQGGMWNFGSWFVGGDNSLLMYQVSKEDEISRIEVITLPQASYMHAFAQSRNKLSSMFPLVSMKRGKPISMPLNGDQSWELSYSLSIRRISSYSSGSTFPPASPFILAKRSKRAINLRCKLASTRMRTYCSMV